jgi:hypothetical protein
LSRIVTKMNTKVATYRKASERERPFYVNRIFECYEDTKDQYTKDALLFQNFLEYSHITEDKPFRYTDIANSVAKKNIDLYNYYQGPRGHTRMSYRLQNLKHGLQRCVNDLICCHLISIAGTTKAEKNGVPTPLYQFTLEGKIAALLITGYANPETRVATIDKILELMQQFYSEYNYYIEDICVKFLENIRKEEVFRRAVIVHILFSVLRHNKRLCEYLNGGYRPDHEFRPHTLIDAMHSSLYLCTFVLNKFLSKGDRNENIFQKIWIKSLMDMDENTRISLLSHYKLNIESDIARAFPPEEWEEVRRKHVQEFSKVVLWGICKNCSRGETIVVSYYQFLSDHLSISELIVDCKKCNAKGSIVCFSSSYQLNHIDQYL